MHCTRFLKAECAPAVEHGLHSHAIGDMYPRSPHY